MATHSLRFPRLARDRQCRPGPQGALVPDQGGPGGGGDECVCYPARNRQSEDDPGAHLAPHACAVHRAQELHEYLDYDGQLFGTQQVVEHREETRSHQALTYDHTGAIGTWAKSELPPGQALREPAPLFKKLDESVVEEEYARLEG